MNAPVVVAPPDPGQLPITSQAGEDITFKLQLNCTAKKSSKMETLRLSPFSPIVRDIKKAIEDKFSIPACVQTLTYQLHTLTNEGCLLDVCKYVRAGDVLTVDYSCDADVEKIKEIISWVEKVMEAMEKEKSLPYNLKIDTNEIICEGSRKNYDIVLALEIFDWMDPKAYVNKIYFEECGGLGKVKALYEIILSKEWAEMPQTYRYIEAFCSHAFANFGETFYFRRVLIERGGMEMAFQSMLRVQMRIEGDAVLEDVDSRWSDEYSQYALKRILENSLHTICNLSELPECQLSIASNSPIVHQALCLSLSDAYHFSISVLVAEMFLCLAHNPLTHEHLAKPFVMHTLDAVCTKWKKSSTDTRRDRLLLAALRCFTLMVFAQMALVSAHVFPVKFIRFISDGTQDFLANAKLLDIIDYEEDQVCVWATLLPYLKLFYLPDRGPFSPKEHPCHKELENVSSEVITHQGDSSSDTELLQWDSASTEKEDTDYQPCSSTEGLPLAKTSSPVQIDDLMDIDNPLPQSADSEDAIEMQSEELSAMVGDMKRYCLEMVLYFLHTKVARDCHCKVLTEEGLVDFVTCLPWHVDVTSREKARQLVQELSEHMQLQPPKLSNLARAVLAKKHFGLERVLKVDSPMDLARELMGL